MTVPDLLAVLREAPLVASVQAPAGSPCDDPQVIRAMTLASMSQGVQVVRLQGVPAIQAVQRAADPVIIGLIKRVYLDSEVYITPTVVEVHEVAAAGAQVVALDATARTRPEDAALVDLVRIAHGLGLVVMGDCDSVESMRHAVACGCDLVGTTLSGYTAKSPHRAGPDLDLVRAARELGVPVIAEGRYEETWQVRAALAAGAVGVVVGGALNDPVKTTHKFLSAARPAPRVGAVDLGGTWLRWAVWEDGRLCAHEKVALPPTHLQRLDWIAGHACRAGVDRIGVSAGGVVDPATARVTDAKDFIADYVGRSFALAGVDVFALNDGLATAWGHAAYADWYGERVATVALGTGVGCGVAGPRDVETNGTGDYPRLNDLPVAQGKTFEDLLGGLNLGPSPDAHDIEVAKATAQLAVETVRSLFQPDRVVVCGGVGLAPWMASVLAETGVDVSPFGPDAGLMGAAMLAANPPARFASGGVKCV